MKFSTKLRLVFLCALVFLSSFLFSVSFYFYICFLLHFSFCFMFYFSSPLWPCSCFNSNCAWFKKKRIVFRKKCSSSKKTLKAFKRICSWHSKKFINSCVHEVFKNVLPHVLKNTFVDSNGFGKFSQGLYKSWLQKKFIHLKQG